ncbi:MBL fold metallo-hydrolase [Candidatus Thorarchaeota archaeon]|nr:MAG: MBL fold metallo-hydrolase [Candidatus Thorarchaeota archaeon]
MRPREIIPGFYEVPGTYVDDFGYVRSHLVVESDDVLVIDPGTAGDPGDTIVDSIKELGLEPRKNVVGILCTHAHPDHVGGAWRLKRKVGAPVMVHDGDTDLLRDPGLFVRDRLLLGLAGRLAMKLERGPLKVNYKGLEPDRILKMGDRIPVGDLSLRVIHTGGHCAGHCVFFERTNKVLFSGDEVNNYANDPRKFYVDLTGSFIAKTKALETLSKLGVEHLFSSHDIPHILGDVALQFQEARDSVRQFQDSIITQIRAREEADIDQLAYDMIQSRGVPLPDTLDALVPTTVRVALRSLEHAGLVSGPMDGVWKLA